MAYGADIDFVKILFDIKRENKNVFIEAALPCHIEAPKKRSCISEERYGMIEKSDRIVAVSEKYYNGCMQKRNKYMVDKSDMVLAVWNGSIKGGTWNTVKYARSKGKNITYIMI